MRSPAAPRYAYTVEHHLGFNMRHLGMSPAQVTWLMPVALQAWATQKHPVAARHLLAHLFFLLDHRHPSRGWRELWDRTEFVWQRLDGKVLRECDRLLGADWESDAGE